MYNTIEDIVIRQYEQQKMMLGEVPLGRSEQRQLSQRLASYLVEEVYEYLRACSYKHFLPISEKPRSSRLLELTDILKYLLSLLIVFVFQSPLLICKISKRAFI